ncbi:hypothetical protein [Riemerella anatipestifer]|uniref:DUF4595 domain-containing protein n=2 Tax=Riemerella anatipestifer TaxID=34085 RepID=A0A1S7DQM2_RIEAN|nr:hypothetical protein [Riemerella anatipestifer]AQY21407.1 hypothetical protein AB406_0449 [Riemerella anatipestifer]MCO4303530.1 hypothetical protein [Riemerella anatipestifer]MCO7352602.1 hypothetical protein [Riemerella anatipestifer]MCT6760566.1 hypothetical protein [Riemerella anatipestifer]MCT6766904.1 hypothetical protein [Riemerella anatipestifer]
MKKVFYLLSMAILPAFLAVSCNRNDDEPTPTPKEELLLPSKEEITYYDNNTLRTTVNSFTYDGTKLTKVVSVSDDEEYATTFTYQDNLLVKVKSDEEDRVFEYDSKGNLVKETQVLSYDNTTVTDIYTYELNKSSVNVTYNRKNVNGDELRLEEVGTYTYTLTPNKQVAKIVGKKTSTSYDGSSTYVYETAVEENYTYDDKNSVYKNISGFDKLGYSQAAVKVALGGINNVLTKSSKYNIIDNTDVYTHTDTYKYIYNDKNFPVEVERVRDEEKVVSKVEYKAVAK